MTTDTHASVQTVAEAAQLLLSSGQGCEQGSRGASPCEAAAVGFMSYPWGAFFACGEHLEAEVIDPPLVSAAEIRHVFRSSKIGGIAGCFVFAGRIRRGDTLSIVRDGVEVHRGVPLSLNRFKINVDEIGAGFEFAFHFDGWDGFAEGDLVLPVEPA